MTFFLDEIIEDGGEGVILRRPCSFYEQGRSDSLIKIKTSQGDAEGLVLEVSRKSVILKLPNSTQIEVEQDDVANLHRALKIGDIVTFCFDTASRREVPSNPKVMRIRTDITWEQIIHDYKIAPQQNVLNDVSQPFTSKPLGFWTVNNNANLRKLFEDFAHKLNLDPLAPETWYSIPRAQFIKFHGKGILQHLGGYLKTLTSLFPDIGLQESNFATYPREHWEQVKNRKKFFIEFAEENSFDPAEPHNWYPVTREQLTEKKGARGVLSHYGGNIARALIHLFPDIGLSKRSLGLWRNPNNKREYFNDYAYIKGFDPLVAENWYSVDNKDLRSFSRHVHDILQIHDNSTVRTLLALYPNIGLDQSKFFNIRKKKNHWATVETRREFFDKIARHRGLDPLHASSWYSITKEIIRSYKGGAAVVSYYGGFIAALQELYPELHLETAKFSAVPAGFWRKKENRKGFFDRIAKENGFDALVANNWQGVSKQYILEQKGAGSVLNWYKGSLRTALADVYSIEVERTW